MRITQYQSNFSTGEIDPLLRARTDLQQYQNALEEATNVVVQPQGGIRRRDGLEFVYNFGQSFTEFKLIPFEFSTTDTYLLVMVVGRIYVFKDNTLQYNINNSGNDYITASDITAAMLDEIQYTQAVDTLILCHEDLQTKRLVRSSDRTWTFENLPLTNLPQYAYALDEHSPNFTITPSATTGNITITASSVTTDTGTAQAGTANTITLKSASSYTSDDDPNGMWITLTGGTGAGQERYISDYVGSTKVATVYPAWTTQPDSSTNYKVAAFAASAANNFAQVENTFGRVKYISYVSDTIMNAVVEVPFFDTSGVVAGNWIGEFGYEDVWSSTRGWPRSATFHEGRLYFGGSKSRPNTVWGSRVIDYFNFDSHTGLDDEAVEATINTNQLNAIVNIVSGADLRILTTASEFIVVQSEDNPITPNNFLVRPQTRLGSKPGVPTVDLNGATIFVQRQGQSINAFQFGNNTSSYQVQNISLLSSHLLKNPSDIAVRRSASTDESDRLFVVNSDDGSMAVYSILTGQNVIAPSKFTTNGEFIAVAVEGSNVFVIVKRTVNEDPFSGGNPVYDRNNYYLEVFNQNFTLDSVVSGNVPPSNNIQVNHLPGVNIEEIVDDNWNGFALPAYAAAGRDDDAIYTLKTGVTSGILTLDGADVSSGVASYFQITRPVYIEYSSTAGTGANVFIQGTDVYDDFRLETVTLAAGTTTGESVTKWKTVTQISQDMTDATRTLKIGWQTDTWFQRVLSETPTTSYQLGLDYDVQVKTMPTEPTLSSGSLHGMKKRIVQVDALVHETKDLKINNQTINFTLSGASDPSEYTGLKTAHGILGYSNSGQITLTQAGPLPMTVLGLEYKLSTGS